MSSKKTILLIVSIFVVIIFTKTGSYGDWFKRTGHIERFNKEKEDLSMRERHAGRYGTCYLIYRLADSIIHAKHTKDPVVYFTPNSYIRKNIPRDKSGYLSPEPATFYYFTGMKGVWTNSPGVEKTNWAILVDKDPASFVSFLPDGGRTSDIYLVYQSENMSVILLDIKNRQELQLILDHYKTYPPEL